MSKPIQSPYCSDTQHDGNRLFPEGLARFQRHGIDGSLGFRRTNQRLSRIDAAGIGHQMMHAPNSTDFRDILPIYVIGYIA
jgi:hypothetical protein